MTYHFVTSMSREGYDEYGKTFLDSYEKFSEWPLTVYTEDPLEDERFPVRSLKFDDEFMAFWKQCDDGSDYRWQAGKFAKKVFAVTAPEYGAIVSWAIWLDADVILEKPLTEKLLKVLCPEDYTGSYLGRKDWHHSECGWVAYNLNNGGIEFLRMFREMYTSGEIFEHMEWHDSYLFDRLREKTGTKWFNLSAGVPGMHVWDGCLLGQFSKHMKGPLRKKGKDGDVPESYWSERERA